MEKKGNRGLPVSRGSTAESKKDGVSKPWLRGTKCRESANGSLSNKPETSRKPPPQKGKALDKRPKPRGIYSTGVASRNEATLLEEQLEAELGSVFIPGSKKQSLNHLLNFTYATPREGNQLDRSPRLLERNGKKGKMLVTKAHKYNKEHFLQANCQFIVNDKGNYKQYLNNPDALVDWKYIEQVNVQVSEYPSCPICLYPPTAAQMTRCGHIYCWPCILHYLSLSDERSRKCPICFEYIRKTELKSVVTIPLSSFNIKDTITFKLMKRPRGGLIAYPADVEIKEGCDLFKLSDQRTSEIYSKLLLAQKHDILTIIARERKELEMLFDESKDCPEECFIKEAINLLAEREAELEQRLFAESLTLSELGIIDDNNIKPNVDIDESDKSSGEEMQKFHYFYQAFDGQHIYLNALNAKMLEHTYGSLEFGPKILKGKILEKEGGSMTLELRKRLRYLQHLPVTCQFEVAEIELKQPIVAKETLEFFHDQLDLRRKKRQRRDRDEKRREKLIEVEENRKIGIFPTPNIQIESNVQFPEFGSDLRMRTESESTMPSERSSSPEFGSTPSSVSLEHVHSGPSFAKMLATEKKKSSHWPSVAATSSSYSERPKLINVTGADMTTSSRLRIRGSSDNEADPEGYEPVPSFNDSFGNALAQALKEAEMGKYDMCFDYNSLRFH